MNFHSNAASQNLPSSMSCKYGESKCEIRYEKRAYLSKNDRHSFANPFNSNTIISSRPIPINIIGSVDTSDTLYLTCSLVTYIKFETVAASKRVQWNSEHRWKVFSSSQHNNVIFHLI